MSVDQGILTLGRTDGLSFTNGDGFQDRTMTFTGSLENINAALQGLKYMSTVPDSQEDTILHVSVNDQAPYFEGGGKTTTGDVVIHMTLPTEYQGLLGTYYNGDADFQDAGENGTVYAVSGGGLPIFGKFRPVPFLLPDVVTGDGEIVAKVDSLTNTNCYAKAGVMFRDSLDPSSTFADIIVTPESGVYFQWRSGYGWGASGDAIRQH